jgi:hypothetical protein
LRAFLQDWWTYLDRRLYSDQEQFDLLLEFRRRTNQAIIDGNASSSSVVESLDCYPFNQTHRHACSDFDYDQQRIVILPPDKINSDPPAMTQQRPENQVLHLMVIPLRM